VLVGPASDLIDGHEGHAVVVTHSHTTSGEPVDRAWVERMAGRWQEVQGQAVPPFAAFAVSGGAWAVVTDHAGLGPLVVQQGRGWAAASTSALHLGQASGGGFDQSALLDLALTGTFVAEGTPYLGVRKLTAGSTAHLEGGHLALESCEEERRAPPATAADGASVVRAATAAAVRPHGSIALELSGGLDSRLLLAALDPDARRRLEAVTIGPQDSDDALVARQVAALAGVEHRHVRLDTLVPEDPADLHEAALRSAIAHDVGGNPIAHLVLDTADRAIGSAPRLSGQNGELLRGFYYGAQPLWARPSRLLLHGLERWRLTSNDMVDRALFEPGLVEAQHRSLVDRLWHDLGDQPGSWPTMTDHLYLRLRMQRWVGTAYAPACRARAILAPFFDPRFTAWALACPPRAKRGSKLASAVLAELDPALAGTALAGRPTPRALAYPTLADRAGGALSAARRVGAKVVQRTAGRTRPPALTTHLGDAVRARWEADAGGLERVAKLPWVRAEVVEAIASGARSADTATVGHLLALEALTHPHGGRSR
jgi:asparagine synthase (glutamine-hydrolysing)